MHIVRATAAAAVVSALGCGAASADALSDAGVYQKGASASCTVGGFNSPGACSVSLAAVPSDRILVTQDISCYIEVPIGSKVVEVSIGATGQPRAGLAVAKIGDYFGRSRFRTTTSPEFFVPSGAPNVATLTTTPTLGRIDMRCTIVGRYVDFDP